MVANNIRHLVYTPDLKENKYIKSANEFGIQCHLVLDARSALYVATGIAAQNLETVVVCVRGSNESRSAYSGMTEAFYRNLPIVLITFGTELDYSRELNDVVNSHFVVQSEDEISQFLNRQYPIHIEVKDTANLENKFEYQFISTVAHSLTDKDYLYLSNKFSNDIQCSCKLVYGVMPNCDDGVLSNVLGASLAKLHNKYVGIVTEKEFLHDMNTLGNINVNDSLLYVVYLKCNFNLISDYAKSLNYTVECIEESKVDDNFIKHILSKNSKTVLIVKED